MSDAPGGPDWFKASDGKWYAPTPQAGNNAQFVNQKKKGGCLKSLLIGLGVLIALIVVIAIASGGGSKSNTSTTSTTAAANDAAGSKPTTAPTTKTPSVPAEYKSALSQAGTYSNTMHMSKKGLYDQLVSPNGGQFSAAAAQYAVDNVKTDWNANALAKAKTYQDTMHLSPTAIHDQLTSDNGEKFTPAEADYAVQHLNG